MTQPTPTERFEAALKRVLVHEGGWSNHPADPGGATMRGVIQRVYDGYRDGQGLARRSVRQITTTELREIYRKQYWDAVRGDVLPIGVDYVVFDGAVNSGPKQSIKWLQRALGVVADGIIGEVTLAALKVHGDHDKLIADICARRLGMLKSLKTWPVFGKGWGCRVADVLAAGQAMATGSVGPKPTWTAEGAQRAEVSEVSKPAAPIGGPVGSIVGGGAIAAGVERAKDALQPLTGSGGIVDTIFVVLVTAAALLAIGGVVYAVWAAQQNRKREAVETADAVADLSELPPLPVARARRAPAKAAARPAAKKLAAQRKAAAK